MAPLWQLCRDGKLEEVRRALARGDDVNNKGEFNTTGLMLAVWKNHNPVVRLLLEQPVVALNCIETGKTALHYAAVGDNVEGVRMLLADPRLNTHNHKNKYGWTPAMTAFVYKKVNALRELVAHPSVNLDTRNNWGLSLEEFARWELISL